MTNAASVKDRLKNEAISTQRSMQDLLIIYGLERTICRISISKYASSFTLKGGIFLYALYNGEFARATRDIDLLANRLPNETDQMKDIFQEILSIPFDDALQYDLNSIEVTSITEWKTYHGVNISVMAYLDRTRIPISMDIGYDDIVYPERVKMDFPVLLDMNTPTVFAYSIYSAIAEKFESIVTLGLANSRYKDFYDIYLLATTHDLDGATLKEAILLTFKHRKTGFNDIVAFSKTFSDDPYRQTHWLAFTKKKKALLQVSFNQVMTTLTSLLEPIIDSIQKETSYEMQWKSAEKNWGLKDCNRSSSCPSWIT